MKSIISFLLVFASQAAFCDSDTETQEVANQSQHQIAQPCPEGTAPYTYVEKAIDSQTKKVVWQRTKNICKALEAEIDQK